MVSQEEFGGVPGLGHRNSAATGHRAGPPASDAFAVATVHPATTVTTASDGDLWPSTWADDGALYTACGDGLGFSTDPADFSEIVVNRIDGTPETGLTGTRLAAGRDVAPIWTDPQRYNSKPTGMIAVDGNGDGRDELYLAVQDLRCGTGPDTFNIAPAAGIVTSTDYGRTWTAPPEPMFTDRLTTLMFLDLGRSNSAAVALRELQPDGEGDPARYAYAYGLDHNWRTSYSGAVPDPTDLYLARVPVDRIADRTAWQFFAGAAAGAGPWGRPQWSRELDERVPVLTDTRRTGEQERTPMAPPPVLGTLLGQGGVVYVPGLRRFLYTSWTEHTFQLYEAPTPWGPWRHFLSHDFGPYPWTGPRSADAHHGGYGTSVPSKFISDDGRHLWLQSNWFVRSESYTGSSYGFSLRPLHLEPMPPADSPAQVQAPGTNLATLPGAAPIARAVRTGHLEVLADGRTDRGVDSWNGQRKETDHWGYTWPRPVRCTRVQYTTGPHDAGSGWFTDIPAVQVRRGAVWHDLPEVTVTPAYPADRTATGYRTYTFTFAPVTTTGIRLHGRPGGWERYTSISELAVYDDGGSG